METRSLAPQRVQRAFAAPSWIAWQTWLTLVLPLVLFAAHFLLYRNSTIDDAYITFRVVRQWVAGNGLVYNVGEYVEAYSNFLWVVLLAPFAWAGTDLVLASEILGIVCSTITLLVTWRFARFAGLPGVAPLFLAASAPFAAWSMGGLETPLFACLVVVSFYTFVLEETRGRGVLSGLWLALLALTRPEGLLFAGVAGLIRLWALWQARRWPERRDWLRLVLVAGIVGVYVAWRLFYYGYPLPNTVYAKSMGMNPRGYLEGAYYLYGSLVAVGGLAIVALPFAHIWGKGELQLSVRTWLAACGAMALFIVLAGGDWMPLQRFAVHVLPLLYLGVEAGLAAMSKDWRPDRRHWLLAFIVAGQLGFLFAQSIETRFLAEASLSPAPSGPSARVRYIEQNLDPANPTIAVVDAGALPYALPLEVRVIDMVGLADSHIAHLAPQFPGGLLGRGDGFGKWDVAYVLDQAPQFVQIGQVARDEDGVWHTNFTGATLLLNHPDFARCYQWVEAPGVTNLFERIDC